MRDERVEMSNPLLPNSKLYFNPAQAIAIAIQARLPWKTNFGRSSLVNIPCLGTQGSRYNPRVSAMHAAFTILANKSTPTFSG